MFFINLLLLALSVKAPDIPEYKKLAVGVPIFCSGDIGMVISSPSPNTIYYLIRARYMMDLKLRLDNNKLATENELTRGDLSFGNAYYIENKDSILFAYLDESYASDNFTIAVLPLGDIECDRVFAYNIDTGYKLFSRNLTVSSGEKICILSGGYYIPFYTMHFLDLMEDIYINLTLHDGTRLERTVKCSEFDGNFFIEAGKLDGTSRPLFIKFYSKQVEGSPKTNYTFRFYNKYYNEVSRSPDYDRLDIVELQRIYKEGKTQWFSLIAGILGCLIIFGAILGCCCYCCLRCAQKGKRMITEKREGLGPQSTSNLEKSTEYNEELIYKNLVRFGVTTKQFRFDYEQMSLVAV